MSLKTLGRMQQSLYNEEAMIRDREKKRQTARKVVLSDEETQKQGEELYAKVVASIKKQMVSKNKASVSCKLRPNCVFAYVVAKLESKGWKAKHVYNDGYNDFDFIDAFPPDITMLL